MGSKKCLDSELYEQNLFGDEACFWLNEYVNKQNCFIWSKENLHAVVKTPLHPEKIG